MFQWPLNKINYMWIVCVCKVKRPFIYLLCIALDVIKKGEHGQIKWKTIIHHSVKTGLALPCWLREKYLKITNIGSWGSPCLSGHNHLLWWQVSRVQVSSLSKYFIGMGWNVVRVGQAATVSRKSRASARRQEESRELNWRTFPNEI